MVLEQIVGSEKKAEKLLKSHDIDVLAEIGDKVMVFQMRSRDDTGGATAKSSLAELLRDLYKTDLKREVLYIIYVWVKPQDSEPQQKVTLVNKLLSMISQDEEVDEKLKRKLEKGDVVTLKDNLKVCVVYGAKELVSTLWRELGVQVNDSYEEVLRDYSRYLELVSSWDDLWLSYAVATLELENLVKHGRTNAALLEEKLSREMRKKLKSRECLKEYRACSAEIAKELSPFLREGDDLIPFKALGDKVNYLRDLILLRIVYEHLESICDAIGVDSTTRKRLQKLQKGNQ